MKWIISILILPALLFASEMNYVVVDIDSIGYEKLQELKQHKSLKWWVELENQLLTLVNKDNIDALQKEYKCNTLPIAVEEENLHFVKRAHQKDLMIPGVEVLGNAGRTAVVQAQKSCVLGIGQCHDSHYDATTNSNAVHASLAPFAPNTVVARQTANEMPSIKFSTRADYSKLADSVDGKRWKATVDHLSSYNRYTHGDGVIEARDWLVQQYKDLGLEVSTQSFSVSFTTAYNVIAVMKGTEKPDEIFIVGGHYDSISQSPSTAAPGSEDNASGASGVLEMARVFAKNPPKSTIIFINFSGEEQGLVGSYKHVDTMIAKGDHKKLKAALIMDMIGYTGDSDLDLLLETADVGKHLFPIFTEAAKQYTSLRIVTSLRPFGSDHVPYIRKGLPALLTIENDWDEYKPYHTTGDLSSKVSTDMGHQVLRMNVVTIGMLMDQD
ncbi:M28 family metallopeptidase [Candidatus Uabimicrobium amorphum]|uniref:Leucyl aminopeptidase n=1 Tax=Uabimicrobium amorphum TaxID=2596890 RepID=A0A5S9IHH3_UABAM|nr:M28 family peptidase [Candidatus Uabimicrobium amorphum]BBM81899.1 leucyl aminopeptidase [Candidatus Uabimicrobium amorphum]